MLVTAARRATLALGCMLAVAACEPEPTACDRGPCRCPDGGGCVVLDAGPADPAWDGGPVVPGDAGGPACEWSVDCGRGLVCVEGACRTSVACEATDACPSPLLCDPDRATCAECLTDEHCPVGDLCRAFVCMPAPEACDSDADCVGVGRWCALDLRYCVTCRAAEDCEGDHFCSADHRCLPRMCEPDTSTCDDDASLSVCRSDGSGHDTLPCPEGEQCFEGACAERSWVTRVGTVARETARAGALLDDGTLVAVSSRDGEGSETYLTAVDRSGELRWSLIASAGFGSSLWPSGAAGTATGVVVVGYHQPTAAFVMKVGSRGDVLWSRTVSYAGEQFSVEAVAAVSGGLLLVGSLRPDVAATQDAFIVKLDDLGEVDWARRFAGTGSEWLSAIAPLADGSAIAFGGTTSFGAGGTDGLAVKVEGDGDMAWANAYGTSNSEGLSGGVQLTGGDIVALGGSSGRSVLVRVNAEGRLVWGRRFSPGWSWGDGGELYTYGLARSAEDELITLGIQRTDSRAPSYPVTTRWTLDGDMLTSRSVPLGANHIVAAFGPTTDDRFWAVFETPSGPGPASPAMARLDDDLTTPCGTPGGAVPVRVDYEPITATSGGAWSTLALTSAALPVTTRSAGLSERACTE